MADFFQNSGKFEEKPCKSGNNAGTTKDPTFQSAQTSLSAKSHSIRLYFALNPKTKGGASREPYFTQAVIRVSTAKYQK